MTLSEAGLQLVLDYEVGGGQKYYDRFLSRPTVPGFESGVTIGIGFDLGYTNLSEFDRAWGSLSGSSRLRECVGLTHEQARRRLPLVADIGVPYERALEVFLSQQCPVHWLRTMRIYPQVPQLPEDCASALFSLVFNRGTSLTGERRTEMLGIKDALATNHLEEVPRLIRAMRRLWPNTSGLVKRRDAEAALFEKGLRG